MKIAWRSFLRCLVAIDLLFVACALLVSTGCTQGTVTQSGGYVDATAEAASHMLSESLPQTATNVRYCRASAGICGRLLLYRFAAPVEDLHRHAEAEFAAHWDKPKPEKTSSTASPITDGEVKSYKSAFGVHVNWMLPLADATGTVYHSSDGQVSHRPTIFVDESNGVLYFRMTD